MRGGVRELIFYCTPDLLTLSYQTLSKLALFKYHVERGTDMETKKAWVDFNLIKAAVTMEMLVVQYGMTGLVRSGDEVRGVCPIHQGKSQREFSINLVKNTFCCFAPKCKARGNVLDFVAKMEECSVRDAALKLNDWFQITKPEIEESGATQTAEQPPADESNAAPEILIAEIESRLTALKQLLAAR